MTRAILITAAAVLVLGAVAGVGYQVGIATGAAVAGAAGVPAVAAYPYYWHPIGFGFFPFFGLLFPLLFILLLFGLGRALFWGGRGPGYGKHWGGPRMLDEWHREAHERGAGGKAES